MDHSVSEPGIASILHVDMDAFFASVEVRDEPSLAGMPVAVAGSGRRGVVTSATYEARRFGVRSAMPVHEARRRCPGLILVPPNFKRYLAASAQIFEVFESVTPTVERISLDEGFLDISGAIGLMGDAAAIASLLRERVSAATGLSASVGGASVKFIAKLASTKAKPDGVLIVDPRENLRFIHPLPVNSLWGVGPATARHLEKMGIKTIGDLARTSVDALVARLGESSGNHLFRLANGIDERVVDPSNARQGISAERTFERDIEERGDVEMAIRSLADAVARRLRGSGLAAGRVGIKVRLASMETITRARTSPEAMMTAREIGALAMELYDSLGRSSPRIRLLGVSAGRLAPRSAAGQLTFDATGDWLAVEEVSDRIRARFGDDAILAPGVIDSSGSGR